MPPFPPAEVLLVLAGGPLLALPGALLLLRVAPGWGLLPRACVGFALTSSLLALGVWALDAWAGVPYTALTVRLLYLALLLAALAQAAPLLRARARLAYRPTWEHALLVGVVALGGVLLLRPRWSDGLPLHVDEWWPLAAGTAMERQATVDFVDPRLGLWTYAQNPEAGFHLFATNLRHLTGADWLAVFDAGPLLLFAFTVVAAWCCARREGYGLEAALLVALLPTGIGVLGPQLFVPLSLGLLFIPATFLLFTAAPPRRALPLVAAMLLFVFFAHPQSAVALGVLMGTYGALVLRRAPWRSAALIALALAPLLLAALLLGRHVDLDRTLGEASSNVPVPDLVALFGVLPGLLFVAGAFLTFLRPTPERAAWLAASVVHLVLIAAFLVLHLGEPHLYNRAWMHGMLTMSLTAAYALHRLRASAPGWRRWAGPASAAALALALVATTATAQAAREREYYHVLTPEEHADLVWIRDHVPSEGSRALVPPWQGTAFSAVTGHLVYAAHPYGTGEPVYDRSDLRGYNNVILAERVLEKGAADEAFLDRFNITLVYTHGEVRAAHFTEVHPDVWVRSPS